MIRIAASFIVLGLFISLWPATAQADWNEDFPEVLNSTEAMDTTYGPHGGKLITRKPYRIETLGCPDGIRIYLYDTDGESLDLDDIQAELRTSGDTVGVYRIKFSVEEDDKQPIPYFRGAEPKRREHLFAPFDYSLRVDGSFAVSIQLNNLPEAEHSQETYSLIFGLTRLRGYICRGHPQRVFLELDDRDLCKKRYQDPVPFLYQCPKHAISRSDRESTCPLCGTERVPTLQSPHPHRPKMREPSKMSPLLRNK
jgi:hypothetical protein